MPKSKLGENYKIDYSDASPLEEELKYFISGINGKKLEVANGDSAVQVMKLLDIATKSLMGL